MITSGGIAMHYRHTPPSFITHHPSAVRPTLLSTALALALCTARMALKKILIFFHGDA